VKREADTAKEQPLSRRSDHQAAKFSAAFGRLRLFMARGKMMGREAIDDPTAGI
jgi:hypothetical protein